MIVSQEFINSVLTELLETNLDGTMCLRGSAASRCASVTESE